MTDLALRIDDAEAVVTTGGVDIARYAFDGGGAASEGPKPYLHPLRTLGGAPLTAYRPWDHRWHKGLQLTWTHVSGENFWGGPTYRRDSGYVQLDNVGRMRHDAFTEVVDAGPAVSFAEQLTWITRAGRSWSPRPGATASTAWTPTAACGSSTSPRPSATSRSMTSSSAARRPRAARTRATPGM